MGRGRESSTRIEDCHDAVVQATVEFAVSVNHDRWRRDQSRDTRLHGSRSMWLVVAKPQTLKPQLRKVPHTPHSHQPLPQKVRQFSNIPEILRSLFSLPLKSRRQTDFDNHPPKSPPTQLNNGEGSSQDRPCRRPPEGSRMSHLVEDLCVAVLKMSNFSSYPHTADSDCFSLLSISP